MAHHAIRGNDQCLFRNHIRPRSCRFYKIETLETKKDKTSMSTYLSRLLYIAPSGGSKWAIEAPYTMQAAKNLGVSGPATVISLRPGRHGHRRDPALLGDPAVGCDQTRLPGYHGLLHDLLPLLHDPDLNRISAVAVHLQLLIRNTHRDVSKGGAESPPF